jgi:hypothetical protein
MLSEETKKKKKKKKSRMDYMLSEKKRSLWHQQWF